MLEPTAGALGGGRATGGLTCAQVGGVGPPGTYYDRPRFPLEVGIATQLLVDRSDSLERHDPPEVGLTYDPELLPTQDERFGLSVF